jgi:hypothetical protein
MIIFSSFWFVCLIVCCVRAGQDESRDVARPVSVRHRQRAAVPWRVPDAQELPVSTPVMLPRVRQLSLPTRALSVSVAVRLKLRTIISLIPERPSADLVEFCVHQKITLYHFPVEKYSESVTLQPKTVAQILEVVNQTKQQEKNAVCNADVLLLAEWNRGCE